MVDFALSPVEQEIQDPARRFVTDECCPLQADEGFMTRFDELAEAGGGLDKLAEAPTEMTKTVIGRSVLT